MPIKEYINKKTLTHQQTIRRKLELYFNHRTDPKQLQENFTKKKTATKLNNNSDFPTTITRNFLLLGNERIPGWESVISWFSIS